jgi:hypothetical protein
MVHVTPPLRAGPQGTPTSPPRPVLAGGANAGSSFEVRQRGTPRLQARGRSTTSLGLALLLVTRRQATVRPRRRPKRSWGIRAIRSVPGGLSPDPRCGYRRSARRSGRRSGPDGPVWRPTRGTPRGATGLSSADIQRCNMTSRPTAVQFWAATGCEWWWHHTGVAC